MTTPLFTRRAPPGRRAHGPKGLAATAMLGALCCFLAGPAARADVLNARTNAGLLAVGTSPISVPFNGQPTFGFTVPGRSPARVAFLFSANCASWGGPDEDLLVSIQTQLQGSAFPSPWRKVPPTDPFTRLCEGANFHGDEGSPTARATVVGVADLRPGTYKVRVEAFMGESDGTLEDMALVVTR